jgi:hypothetical protein
MIYSFGGRDHRVQHNGINGGGAVQHRTGALSSGIVGGYGNWPQQYQQQSMMNRNTFRAPQQDWYRNSGGVIPSGGGGYYGSNWQHQPSSNRTPLSYMQQQQPEICRNGVAVVPQSGVGHFGNWQHQQQPNRVSPQRPEWSRNLSVVNPSQVSNGGFVNWQTNRSTQHY